MILDKRVMGPFHGSRRVKAGASVLNGDAGSAVGVPLLYKDAKGVPAQQ